MEKGRDGWVKVGVEENQVRRGKGERSVVRERKSVVEKGRDFWFWGKNGSVEEERGGEAISLTPFPALFLPFQPNHSFTFCTYARWKASRVSNVIMTMLEHIDQRAREGGGIYIKTLQTYPTLSLLILLIHGFTKGS